jgi:hypothetical protein
MSKRVWLLPALAILLVAVGGSAAFAVPSLGGPSGIVSVPNALVAPVGQAAAAVSWQQMQGLDLYSDTGLGDFSVWSLQVLGGVASGAELWAAYSNSADDLDTTAWGIGGKFQFLREPEAPVTLAVGASYQKETGDVSIAVADEMYATVDLDLDANVWKAYLAASKDFTPTGLTTEWAAGTRIVGTAGVLWLSADLDVTLGGSAVEDLFGGPITGSGSESLFRPFLGVEFMGTQGTTLGLEYRWKDSDLDFKNVFSAVLRQCFPNGFFGEVGTTNADQVGLGLDDQNFFVRAGYVFSFGQY